MIAFRPYCQNDLDYIADNLRDDDIREIAALGLRPKEAINACASGADWCQIGVVDGEPAMLFGYADHPLNGEAEVFALGTDRLYTVKKQMVIYGRAKVAEMLQRVPVLYNYAYAKNRRSLRWLQVTGFSIGEPEPFGVYGEKFCRIEIRRGLCA